MGATERVKQFIDYKGISKYKFCKDLGFSNKFLDNSSNMGTDKACKILHHFPEISPEWLLMGTGQMLKQEITIQNSNRKTRDSIVETQEIPLYDIEATAGLVELFRSERTTQILETIKIPNIPRCDGAVPITGDSMYPLLKSGDIVLYKEIPVQMQSIFFGEMYLLGVKIDETDELITVKYVQKSDLGDNYIKLVSQNQHHQPKDVPLSHVTAMAMIKVSIRMNTML